MAIETPWVISAEDLARSMQNQKLVIVDISNVDSYRQQHIGGARFLDYSRIVRHDPPVMGLLPEAGQFSTALQSIGLRPDDYLIAYDEEGGGKASRLLWTLEIAGHKKMSLLDGGIVNWVLENKPTSRAIEPVAPSEYPLTLENLNGVAGADYILQHLHDPQVKILDTRSPGEFLGTDVRAARAGHIPGAVNIDWQLFKQPHSQKLLEAEQLENLLLENGLTKDKEIIVHCHSHHRSALSYVALKHLGYTKVRGYPGSWSDWANRHDTPVELASNRTTEALI